MPRSVLDAETTCWDAFILSMKRQRMPMLAGPSE